MDQQQPKQEPSPNDSQSRTPPEPVRQGMFSRLVSKLREDVVGWATKGILAAVAATALSLWHPIWRTLQRIQSDRHNIPVLVAANIARSQVNSAAIWTIPFRNVGDPMQYIVTWIPPDLRICEAKSRPDYCSHGEGDISAHLLLGSGDLFEDEDLHLPAMPMWATANPGDEDQRNLFTAVTDWNHDGKKEILGIVDQSAATARAHTYYISLFDTATDHFNQLRITVSPTDRSEQFVGPDSSPALRIWLSERFDEFDNLFGGENCHRNDGGALTCAKIESETDDVTDPQTNAIASQIGDLEERWLHVNGRTFTTGKIHLEYGPGLLGEINKGERCTLVEGTYDLYNYFKGPLALTDIANNRSTILYMEDGNHLREIPGVIVGREYIWLGLSVHNRILAVRRSDMSVIAFSVHGWENGLPAEDNASNPASANDKDAEADEDEPKTKEDQLPLRLNKGFLVSDNGRVRPYLDGADVSASEFASAHQCGLP